MFPKLKNKAILAPMAGVTDVAFRALCKEFGAALTYTEFVSSVAITRGNTDTLKMLDIHKSEKPIGVQLFGSDVKEIVEAGNILQKRFDIIDVNCGCPAYKVIKTGAGSEMLRKPEKIAIFVEKLVKAIDKPITVKIRTGIDKKHVNALEVAKKVEGAGAAAITIHGRTQDQGYSGEADWELIKKVKETVNIPVIGNGDIFKPQDFKKRLEESGVDYIMIGRAAMNNPYLFKQIDDYMKKGKYENPDKKEIFYKYLELAKENNVNFQTIKRHSLSFTKGFVGGSELRMKMIKTNTVEEITDLYKTFKKPQRLIPTDEIH